MTPEPRSPALAGLATVRLTIDGLRQTVLHCLETHQDTLRATIEHYTNEAVANFNFAAEIARVAADAIREQVRQIVAAAVAQALQQSDLFHTIVTDAVEAAIEQRLRSPQE